MNKPIINTHRTTTNEQRDFMSYVWGFGLALILTLVSFALVQWPIMARGPLLIAIALLALAQIVVHFHFFLHLDFKRKREDLLLVLFSASLLIIMVAGTIWIMANLAERMTIPI
ncbi:cytochrome o ubiquinol oxidase subunit IV [Nitrosomonas eutropha]|jgi:cytochrome o ubiquinol oxidase operon protein cyoD|uniref:cytochrome o ubiquinol oxidase subunit IV n=1 Tax=Nitrosomonas eutropha TaxID=916 RepID=UPI0008B02F16|nr:cytochrome C oxidase subunit IV family protein [Nitrosomonas eutropha]SEJ08004.1 cytochrome bo3 quinol oxidase subunit 4 [Nitrosomonas eutropha]